MPIDLLIYIAISVVLIVWLRNTIGSKHGSETDRSDILEQIKQRQQANDAAKSAAANGRIIDLSVPSEENLKLTEDALLNGVLIEGGAETASEVMDFLRSTPDFDPKSFINGAKEAFPMIVESFAKGDLKTLKMLLSDGVYSTFESAIEDRRSKGETLITDVHAVKECRLMGVKKIDKMVYIKLRFVADESIAVRDREGNIIHGNPDKIVTMNDVWTFGQPLKSKDPTWYLYETSDDVIEEIQNPIPDSK